MLNPWIGNRRQRSPRRFTPPFFRPRLEALEDRCVPATLSVNAFSLTGTEGGSTNFPVGSVVDSDTTVTQANIGATVDWGDGTAPTAGTVTPTGPGTFDVSATHQYLEESTPTFPVTLTVTDTKNLVSGSADSSATVADAALSPGNPVSPGTPAPFGGVGTAGATAALKSFEAAVGGVDHGATSQPLTGGFRTINWDAVKLDGTDSGGGPNTVVISSGSTVGIPLDRFQTRGVYFDAIYAVSGDGFATVNPNVAGLFPAFSPKNTFAMFNDNTIDFHFVGPSPSNSTVVPAASRGFGAIFLNVRQPDTTSIEYFHGSTSLGKFFVQPGAAGQAEFLGELFGAPVVTNITITLGTDVLFSFDGTTFHAGGKDDATHNLVATDDFVYAEPVPISNGSPIVGGPQGTINAQVVVTALPQTPFSGVAATFSDGDPGANANDFTATINWGDGHLTPGTVRANAQGGFDVLGTNAYLSPGVYTISVDVMDFGGESVTVSNAALVGTANQRLVEQLYLDLLQRQADGSGLAFWSAQLDAGAPAQSIALGIEGSPEYQKLEVQQLYLHYLHRTADAQGLAFFTGQLAAGATTEQVASEIVSSSEYFNVRGGGSNSGALAALFGDALGRAITPAEQSSFAAQFSNGASFGDVSAEVFNSQEFSGHLIDVLFQDFLRRRADASGVSFFGNTLSGGSGDPVLDVIAGILGSGEYNSKVQANPLLLPAVPLDPLTASIS
jgi:hypothetical protein